MPPTSAHGSQVETKHGKWGYAFRYGTEPDPKQPGRQRPRQFRKLGFPSKRAAQSAEVKLRASLDAGTYIQPTNRTLGEYAREVIKQGKANGRWKPTTLANYQRHVELFIAPSRVVHCAVAGRGYEAHRD